MFGLQKLALLGLQGAVVIKKDNLFWRTEFDFDDFVYDKVFKWVFNLPSDDIIILPATGGVLTPQLGDSERRRVLFEGDIVTGCDGYLAEYLQLKDTLFSGLEGAFRIHFQFAGQGREIHKNEWYVRLLPWDARITVAPAHAGIVYDEKRFAKIDTLIDTMVSFWWNDKVLDESFEPYKEACETVCKLVELAQHGDVSLETLIEYSFFAKLSGSPMAFKPLLEEVLSSQYSLA